MYKNRIIFPRSLRLEPENKTFLFSFILNVFDRLSIYQYSKNQSSSRIYFLKITGRITQSPRNLNANLSIRIQCIFERTLFDLLIMLTY